MSRSRKTVLSDDHATALADLFRLLGDPTRLRIVVSCLRTPLAVSDIAGRLDLSVSLVSHHLRLLRGARLVRGERQGKQIYYEADDAHVRRMVEDMVTHVAEH
jgi:ArsR family transcriptional regulator, lead/cadmium/zinc/bismuth-responsive transcriptional repressor